MCSAVDSFLPRNGVTYRRCIPNGPCTFSYLLCCACPTAVFVGTLVCWCQPPMYVPCHWQTSAIETSGLLLLELLVDVRAAPCTPENLRTILTAVAALCSVPCLPFLEPNAPPFLWPILPPAVRSLSKGSCKNS